MEGDGLKVNFEKHYFGREYQKRVIFKGLTDFKFISAKK